MKNKILDIMELVGLKDHQVYLSCRQEDGILKYQAKDQANVLKPSNQFFAISKKYGEEQLNIEYPEPGFNPSNGKASIVNLFLDEASGEWFYEGYIVGTEIEDVVKHFNVYEREIDRYMNHECKKQHPKPERIQ